MSKKLGILVLVIAIIVLGLSYCRDITTGILVGLGKILLVAAVVIAIVNVVYYLFLTTMLKVSKHLPG